MRCHRIGNERTEELLWSLLNYGTKIVRKVCEWDGCYCICYFHIIEQPRVKVRTWEKSFDSQRSADMKNLP